MISVQTYYTSHEYYLIFNYYFIQEKYTDAKYIKHILVSKIL